MWYEFFKLWMHAFGSMNNNDPMPDNPPDIVPPKPAPSPLPDKPTINGNWVAVLNKERAQRGKKPMVSDSKLEKIAQQWADSMAHNDVLSHGNFASRINSVYPNTFAAENIAYGSSDVDGTNQQWKNSPMHWQNMMGNYNRTGIGRAVSQSGNVYWCADFVLD